MGNTPSLRAWGFFLVAIRTSAFIDGFNLYHAVVDLGRASNHLKWLDLRRLCATYAPTHGGFRLNEVFFFTAFARWRPKSMRRHRLYVQALESAGVTPVISQFKEKERSCPRCHRKYLGHEEKETDVRIAVRLFEGAALDEFDRALIVSGDSDLAPAIRAVRRNFPGKQVRIVTPVGRWHSVELANGVGGFRRCTKMLPVHLENSLLPERVALRDGRFIRRPKQYRPPT